MTTSFITTLTVVIYALLIFKIKTEMELRSYLLSSDTRTTIF